VRPLRLLSETDEDNNALGPSELKLQISITTDKTVLELKQAIAEKSDVGADRQRLIYSGSSFFVLVFLVSY
jgi:ubiquilin